MGGKVAHHGATPALAPVLGTGKGEALRSAALQAGLGGHRGGVGLGERVAEGTPDVGVVGEAAELDVVGNGDILGIREGRVLPDGDDVVATAGLRLVAGAGKGALGLGEEGAVDGLATEALAVVLEAGISVAVALALGHALLDGHGLGVETGPEAESIRVARVGEASGIDKGPEGLSARGELDVPCLGLLDEGDSRNGQG